MIILVIIRSLAIPYAAPHKLFKGFLKLPRCIFTVADRKQSKAVISFEEWNWKGCSAALQFRTPFERFFSFLSHVHLRPFSFILNPKAVNCLHTFEIQNTANVVAMDETAIYEGTCQVRNEIETKRNETKCSETNCIEKNRNEIKQNETKQNETKRNVTGKKNEKFNMAWRLRGFIIYWLSKFRRLKGFPVLYYNDYPNLLYLSIFFLNEILNNCWNYYLRILDNNT